MHLIAYSSQYSGDPAHIDWELRNICEVAKEKNPECEITGVLFYHQGTFVQVIEGPRKNLESLFAKISDDPRHHDIQIHVSLPVEIRGFSDWNMDSFNLSEETKISTDTLKKISEAYKRTLVGRSDLLTRFYKNLLKKAAH